MCGKRPWRYSSYRREMSAGDSPTNGPCMTTRVLCGSPAYRISRAPPSPAVRGTLLGPSRRGRPDRQCAPPPPAPGDEVPVARPLPRRTVEPAHLARPQLVGPDPHRSVEEGEQAVVRGRELLVNARACLE